MQTLMQNVRLAAARRRRPLLLRLRLVSCLLVSLPVLALVPVGCGISKPAAVAGTGGASVSGSGGSVSLGGSGGALGGGGAGGSAGTGGGGDEPGTGGTSGAGGASDTGGAGDAGGAGDTGGTSGGGIASAGLQYNGVIRFFRGAP